MPDGAKDPGAGAEPLRDCPAWVRPLCVTGRRTLSAARTVGVSGPRPLASTGIRHAAGEEAALADESSPIAWQKSSYSGTESNEDCCEVAFLLSEVRVRDSKRPEPEVLRFSRQAWRAAVAHFGQGQSTGGGHEPC
ncbi:DUF397 domain-containing protein [Streptomyces sp. NPDC050263]|uniref:DUF397 domain-containing protein n=1 Tax=Streptomyces sp. NPDC050263 TaxID=3155037 RepID=UPI0034369A42